MQFRIAQRKASFFPFVFLLFFLSFGVPCSIAVSSSNKYTNAMETIILTSFLIHSHFIFRVCTQRTQYIHIHVWLGYPKRTSIGLNAVYMQYLYAQTQENIHHTYHIFTFFIDFAKKKKKKHGANGVIRNSMREKDRTPPIEYRKFQYYAVR